jgi:hypothetical protein
MNVLLEGLFVALVLVLELVGVVVLGRSTLSRETHSSSSSPAGGSATATTYILTAEEDDDGGAYWVDWEDSASCGLWGVPGEGDIENLEVNRFESEVVGRGSRHRRSGGVSRPPTGSRSHHAPAGR